MTATPARSASRPPQRPYGQWPVGDRSLLPSVLGIPPLGAVGFAFGFTALGVFVDMQRIGTVGGVFQALHFTGCVLAVTWVRRRNLFGPVVQPPLLLAVAVPAIVLLGDGGGTGAAGSTLLTVAAPLINSFPTMAVTSGVVLAVGLFRFAVQRERRGDDGTPWKGRNARHPGSGRGAAEDRAGGATAAGRRRPGDPAPRRPGQVA